MTVAELTLNVKEVAKRRKALGLTLQQAADLAGFNSRQAWYHVETGMRGDITVSTLGKIARALRCKPEDLLK